MKEKKAGAIRREGEIKKEEEEGEDGRENRENEKWGERSNMYRRMKINRKRRRIIRRRIKTTRKYKEVEKQCGK